MQKTAAALLASAKSSSRDRTTQPKEWSIQLICFRVLLSEVKPDMENGQFTSHVLTSRE